MINPISALLALLTLGLFAQAEASPAWWATRGVINSSLPADDYSKLNIGQLKHMAAEARNELNAFLPNGAGSAIDSLITGWTNTANADDYAICNLGQLKSVAKLFWDRLIAEGYATADEYPWTATTDDDDDYAAANVGQLKNVFNISADRDNDNLLDSWEIQYAGSLGVLDGTNGHDYSGDGISDLTAYQIGWDPTVNHLNDTAKTESLTYDAAHRLTGVSGRSGLGYTPDANGNLVQTTRP